MYIYIYIIHYNTHCESIYKSQHTIYNTGGTRKTSDPQPTSPLEDPLKLLLLRSKARILFKSSSLVFPWNGYCPLSTMNITTPALQESHLERPSPGETAKDRPPGLGPKRNTPKGPGPCWTNPPKVVKSPGVFRKTPV